MYFVFCFYFFNWYYLRNCEFCKGLEICAVAAGIKEYKSIIKKKKNNLNKTVLLAKSKINSIEILISKASIDIAISHG